MRDVRAAEPAAATPRARITALRIVTAICMALLLGSALDAISVGSLPIPWLARLGSIALAGVLAIIPRTVTIIRRLFVVPGTWPMAALIIWAGLVTVPRVLGRDLAEALPPLATSGYLVFVSARFLVLLAFLASAYLGYWFLVRGHREAVLRATVLVGTLIAVIAIYVYYAQVFGLPDVPRTRIGTGGGPQAVTFTYPFHRALGTFREPSHLAEWLVVPFLLSFEIDRRVGTLPGVLICFALLLTGSLTGFLGVFLGVAAAAVAQPILGRVRLDILFRMAVVALVGVLLFSVAAVSNEPGGKNLLKVAEVRVSPMLSGGGPQASNRGYIYAFLRDTPIPIIGHGLGLANLLLTRALGTDAVASFLSLYFNTLFSSGIVGLLLLAAALLWPPAAALFAHRRRRGGVSLVVLAAYLAWLAMFAVNAEELSIMFGLAYALLAYEGSRQVAGAGRR